MVLTVQNSVLLIGGDRAFARFASDPYVYGGLMVAVVANGHGEWLHLADNVTATYRAGSMEWSGTLLGRVGVQLSAMPMAASDDNGFTARIQVHMC